MNEIPEDLLLRMSAFMDGEGDDTQRLEIENEIRRHPAAAEMYSAWCSQRKALKTLGTASANVSLPHGFADRVVDEAIEFARREGCDEHHPLVLAGQSPSAVSGVGLGAGASLGRRFSGARHRRLIVVATMAASVLAVAWLGRGQLGQPSGSGDPMAGGMALMVPPPSGSDPSATDPIAVDPISNERSSAGTGAIADSDLKLLPDSRSVAIEMATGDSFNRPVDSAEPNGQFDSDAEVGERAMASSDTKSDRIDVGGLADAREPSGVESVSEMGLSRDASLDDALGAIGVLLVVEVTCNDGVDRNNLLRDAMDWAGIDDSAEHEIDDSLVAAANEAVVSDSPFQLVFLNAPARKLDRLYLRLASDRQQVASVGLSLANDVKLLELSDSINQDPALIRDTAVAVQISGDAGIASLADRVEALTFLPIADGDLSFGSLSAGGPTAAASGPDEMAQILFVVR